MKRLKTAIRYLITGEFWDFGEDHVCVGPYGVTSHGIADLGSEIKYLRKTHEQTNTIMTAINRNLQTLAEVALRSEDNTVEVRV